MYRKVAIERKPCVPLFQLNRISTWASIATAVYWVALDLYHRRRRGTETGVDYALDLVFEL